MSTPAGDHVLVVDDDPNMTRLLVRHLSRAGYRVSSAGDGAAALEVLSDDDVDVVLSDVRMPGLDGIALVDAMRDRGVGVPIILMTAFGTIDRAVDAMRRGAFDYISKPFPLERAARTVRRAIDKSRAVVTRIGPADEDQPHSVAGIVGVSPAIQEVFGLLERAAQTDVTVLIGGASGTGKELVARAIHDLSARRDEAFVVIDCSAMPEPLLESELFGYLRGAFTGADKDRRGLFEHANRGTLFLDEITCLSQAAQAKLLRAIEDHSIRRLGSTERIDVDVRYVAAANVDLEEEVRSGRFREDLFFRFNVIRIELPPLRERSPDIPLLAEHFLQLYRERYSTSTATAFAADAMRALTNYNWPGNVRELGNVIERALVLCVEPTIGLEHLPDAVRSGKGNGAETAAIPELKSLVEEHIHRALRATDGNRSAAAKLLGIDRRTLQRHMKRLADGDEDS